MRGKAPMTASPAALERLGCKTDVPLASHPIENDARYRHAVLKVLKSTGGGGRCLRLAGDVENENDGPARCSSEVGAGAVAPVAAL